MPPISTEHPSPSSLLENISQSSDVPMVKASVSLSIGKLALRNAEIFLCQGKNDIVIDEPLLGAILVSHGHWL